MQANNNVYNTVFQMISTQYGIRNDTDQKCLQYRKSFFLQIYNVAREKNIINLWLSPNIIYIREKSFFLHKFTMRMRKNKHVIRSHIVYIK